MIESVDWKNKKQVLEAVQQNGLLLELACRSLRNHRTVVLAAVQSRLFALEHARPERQADPEIIAVANSL